MRIPAAKAPLVLDVRELLEHPGTQHPISFDAPVGDLRSGLSAVDSDVHFDLTVEAIDGGVLVRGEMSGSYVSECRRCLKPVRQIFSYTSSELYRPPTDVWEEGYAINETSIDLEPMVRDTVALNLPENPLCSQDCKGLCGRCGADLNDGFCGCAVAEEGDIRWSALRELGRDLNG
jgi:uncharacterized protein